MYIFVAQRRPSACVGSLLYWLIELKAGERIGGGFRRLGCDLGGSLQSVLRCSNILLPGYRVLQELFDALQHVYEVLVASIHLLCRGVTRKRKRLVPICAYLTSVYNGLDGFDDAVGHTKRVSDHKFRHFHQL